MHIVFTVRPRLNRFDVVFFVCVFICGWWGGVTALSRIFHLYRADRSSKVDKNGRTQGKTT